MSDDDAVEDLFDNTAVDAEDDIVQASAPRKLMVTFGVALAAFVFIGVAGGALLFFLVLRIRDHTDPNHTVRARYTNSYTRCVQTGANKYTCGIQVLQACEADKWWNDSSRVDQRETVCLATVPDVTGN